MAGARPGKVTRSETAEMCSIVPRVATYWLMSSRSDVRRAARLPGCGILAALAAPDAVSPAAPSRAQVTVAADNMYRALLRTWCGFVDLMSAPWICSPAEWPPRGLGEMTADDMCTEMAYVLPG